MSLNNMLRSKNQQESQPKNQFQENQDKTNQQYGEQPEKEKSAEDEWEPALNFSKDTNVQPPDFLSVEEPKLIRQAALDYGSIPAYDGLSKEERARWKNHVSQVLRKPLKE